MDRISMFWLISNYIRYMYMYAYAEKLWLLITDYFYDKTSRIECNFKMKRIVFWENKKLKIISLSDIIFSNYIVYYLLYVKQNVKTKVPSKYIKVT